MSIRDSLNDCLGNGQLFQVFPTLPGAPVNRILLVSPEVNKLVIGPWVNEKEHIRAARLWADFDRYVEGRLISVVLDSPYRKARATYMSRLDPIKDDVFEIRSRDPKPGIRVFGRFPEQDVFVALNWEYRENLGGPQDRKFDRERSICLAHWRRILPAYNSINGGNLNDYFSDTTNVFSN